ncbi:hypothetical protein CRYUN_Cryun38cG0047100 [Craigia yunnanensis]
MSSSTSQDRVALLSGANHGNEETKGRWWRRVLDLEEANNQVFLSLPMILCNVSYFSITLVSVMFAGHLGELELAGATLANSWASVTGFAFMIGLSGALETLCGQGFGAKLYRMLGLHLQASCIISCLFSVIISILWIYTEPIFIFLHQDPQISKTAALYMKHLIPGLFAFGFVQNILRFLQTQSIVMPLVWFSILPMGLHFGIVYTLVNWTSLGFKGASLAASISLWISFLLLAFYVVCTKKLKQTWEGLSSESFCYILTNLKVALPSAAMFCLEDWAFEFLVLLAGLMPNSNISTSLIAMCVNTEAIAFMFTCGLSAAASTRVANELGAGNPKRAKSAMVVTLKLSIILTLAVVLALAFGHNVWAGFFSDSALIVKQFGSMIPLLVISITIDSFQGILSAVARGCGWQHLGVWANLGTFFFIGMPIACLLGFMLKLYDKGLWIGLICGLSCQASALLSITWFSKWTKIDLSVQSGQIHLNFELELKGLASQDMSRNTSLDTVALLPETSHEEEEEIDKGSCWSKALDLEETKIQISFSLPMILSNVFYFSITLVSVMFAGHLGDLELAAATLANSWATVTGYAFMTGLSGALETLCGQAFGAKLYRMLGIYLQASCIISFLFSVIISILWFYTEPILVLLHQDPEISRTAALYMKYLIPGLFAYGFVQNILRFLQTQSIVIPLVLFSVIPLGIHFGIVYSLVNRTSLGFKGAPLAASISLWISFLLLAMYVVFEKKFENTWKGSSLESFHYILRNLKLALPSAAMVCLEFWAFEILVFLAGLMPNSEITTSLIAIW